MANIFKPPSKLPSKRISVFLAGSIEQGKAIEWQKQVEEELKDIDIDIFNPRRDEWDSSLRQEVGNDIFKEQVEWELDALDKADIIFMYFDPDTKSPITLLELGLYANSKKLLVCCPIEYWRSGNVHIVMMKYNIVPAMSIEQGILLIKQAFQHWKENQ